MIIKRISLVFIFVITIEGIFHSIVKLTLNALKFFSFNWQDDASLIIKIFLVVIIFLLISPTKTLLISVLQTYDNKWLKYQPSILFLYSTVLFVLSILCKVLIEHSDTNELTQIDENFLSRYWLFVITYTIIAAIELIWAEYKIDKNRVENLSKND